MVAKGSMMGCKGYPGRLSAWEEDTNSLISKVCAMPVNRTSSPRVSLWEGRKVPTKSLFEQEAPKIGTQKCSTKRGVRGTLHVEFALKNRELVKAEVFEKRVFEQTAPLK